MSKTTAYNEPELLKRMAQSDEAAFTIIYERYHGPIYTFLLGFVKVPALAEDILHDVFMTIWEMRERLNIQISLSAYLYRASRNKAITMLERIANDSKLRKEVIEYIHPTLTEATDPAIRIREYERMLNKALAGLPPQRRKVFMLCKEEGKSYQEVATLLGISPNTVKEHMAKAHKYLRGYILEKGDLSNIIIILLIAELF